MIDKEEYEKLMATLERIEKAGTLADIVKNAPDPSWEDMFIVDNAINY